MSQDYGIGYTSRGQPFYFDLEDYDLISDYLWHIDSNGYVKTNTKRTDGKRSYLFMHHLIMNINDNSQVIDHIHGTKNDNRKSNLRVVTKSQNNINQKIRKDNKTHIKGVNLKTDIIKGKKYTYWQARIQVEGKRIELGRYKNITDAIKARKEAEKIYHGNYSYDVSQKI